MKILVTGHRGYIGSHLYKKLLENNIFTVTGIDLKEGKDILHDLPEENYDIIFHMAAFPRVGFSYENPSYTFKNNSYATSVLLEWAKNHGVKRFIFSSSSSVNGDGAGPISPYGLQKLISENECKLYSDIYGLDTVCLRYYNVYSEDQEYGGSYSTIISSWMHKMKNNEDLLLFGDGEQSRDFIHVEDIVSANIFCLHYSNNFNGQFYDVGSGKVYSVNYIKNIILQLMKPNFLNLEKRKGDVMHTKISNQNLLNLGWKCEKNFEDEIRKYFSNIIQYKG
jgi:UDP-glucose 4-epimerase